MAIAVAELLNPEQLSNVAITQKITALICTHLKTTRATLGPSLWVYLLPSMGELWFSQRKSG